MSTCQTPDLPELTVAELDAAKPAALVALTELILAQDDTGAEEAAELIRDRMAGLSRAELTALIGTAYAELFEIQQSRAKLAAVFPAALAALAERMTA